jgi:predicted DNA-binding transcriptional regulator AlpA
MSEDPAIEAPPRLPHFIRFKDLRTSGIADSWTQLARLIAEYNFPPGVMISPNVRGWNIEDVKRWLATRPTDRKVIRRTKEPEPEAA